jgi:quercetin dioxygenase-like cupin family protein
MKIKNEADLNFELSELGGAKGVYRKYLIIGEDGAKKFYMRMYKVEKDGYTPLHKHEYEHEVFVLNGEGVIVSKEGEKPIRKGDAIYIGSNELHQLKNYKDEPLVFICIRGLEEIY